MHKKLAQALVMLLGATALHAAASPTAASTAQSNVHVMPAIAMDTLQRERTYRIYLPTDYQDSDKSYPVLYMHDGQNLFDDATSYVGEWGVDESLNLLAQTCGLEVIVVGIDHGDKLRMTELNPYDNERFGKGEGNAYVDFLVKELKPRIDREYRTLADREHTAIMGSSMGGLISNHAINRYPDIFGMAGIFSPSYWIAPGVLTASANNPQLDNTRVYLLTGAREGDEMTEGFMEMEKILKSRGKQHLWQAKLDGEGNHSETFWRREFPIAINWLFGASCQQ
ncbi:alpha/beta hydrolase [Microbulbifer pacificus]|uniref:Alpha/beta hydrolase-fold protein n=1 Tax=Microbulbifer pacificus TaxID=407164 RepID=A0AAU0N5K3_9GAMM|nr:alpha/beta hydrolase-fold protein [Microbulbifer pacificus]WOX06876.1 alpha/beta hydrolase-fold protein [Microbulbifer pacificus]